MIEKVEVKTSSVITEMKYNDFSKDLLITFKTGRVYRYTNVEGKEWRDFRDSHSKGRYFNDYIRNHYVGFLYY